MHVKEKVHAAELSAVALVCGADLNNDPFHIPHSRWSDNTKPD